MKLIGLCGGSGSGKGTAASIFLKHSIPSVDTDALYREMTSCNSPCLDALSGEFGNSIIRPDGSLDRKALADIVFCGEDSQNKRKRLNEITHKFILDEARVRLEEFRRLGYPAAIIDAPVLFESGFDKECYVTVCVVADKNVRIDRIMSRDGLTESEAIRRINAQISDDDLIKKCNFYIRNDSDIDALSAEIDRLIDKLELN